MDSNDRRILADRHQSLEDELDRSRASPTDAGRALLCQTTSDGDYPATAGGFFAVVEVEVDGTEAEGAGASFTPADHDDLFFAFNLGTTTPPEGTYVICRFVGGHWCFRYDG